MKAAYIYTRVSKKSQADGEGLDRQQQRAEEYINTLDGYKLAKHNAYYEDSGLSAYSGSNIRKGALGKFLEDCKNGEIEEGSLLVIEFIDRLSRLKPRQARGLFNEILDYKINVAIARWNTIVYHDEGEDDLGSDLMLTCGIQLAWRESNQKSERIKATIKIRQDRAREKGAQKRTQVCPSWLNLSEDRTEYLIDEKKSKIVQRIFNMKIYDRLGNQSIAKKLNELSIKPIGKTKIWGLTAIANILKNRAVLGEFQPMSRIIDDTGRRVDTPYGDLIEDYYPRILSNEDFKTAQSIRLKKSSVTSETLRGRTAGFKNLFRHLTICLDCESPLNYKGKYLACSSIHCDAPYANYQLFEEKLLNFFKGAAFLQLASNIDIEERSKQEEEINNLESEISEVQSSNNNLLDTMQSTNNNQIRDSILKRLEDNNIKINKLKDKINKIDIVDVKSEEISSDIDLTDVFVREKYNALLRKIIKHIKFYDDFVFVCLKNKPNQEAVFHLNAKGYIQLRDLIEEPDKLEFLKEEYSHFAFFRVLTILDRQDEENLTWKQTNRILREENLQEVYELWGKGGYEVIKESKQKLGKYGLEDFGNENFLIARDMLEE